MNNIEEMIKELHKENGIFALDAINFARNNKNEASDRLVAELMEIIKQIDEEKLEYTPLFCDYAVFLLAEFKDKRLFDLIIKLCVRPNIKAYDFFGEGLMEHLPSAIMSVFNGEQDLINDIIFNKEIDDDVKGSFLKAFAYLYKIKKISKEEFLNYLRSVIAFYSDVDNKMLTPILEIIRVHKLIDMIDDVKKLYDEDMVEIYIFGEYYRFIDYLFNDKDSNSILEQPITDIICVMSNWACFKQQKINKPIKITKQKYSIQAKSNKNGRNDPCPCGSGKKYKQCCLNITPFEKYLIKRLETYPKSEVFYNYFDNDAIEIDKLLYAGLYDESFPFFTKLNNNIDSKKIEALDKALILIDSVIDKNNIKSTLEFDQKYCIHFSIYDFVNVYQNILMTTNDVDKFTDLIVMLYKLDDNNKNYVGIINAKAKYFILTKRYDEGIEYFEGLLNTSEYRKEDVCLCLFNLYDEVYDEETKNNRINYLIENAKDEETKNTIIEITSEDDFYYE